MRMKAMVLIYLLIVVFFGLTYSEAKTDDKKEGYQLSVPDRLAIMNTILPRKASIIKSIVISAIREKLKVSERELDKYLKKDKSDWKAEAFEITIEYYFTEPELEVFRDALQDLDRKEKIPATIEFIMVYKKLRK